MTTQRTRGLIRGSLAAALFIAILVSCSNKEMREEGDDAFITPSGEGAAAANPDTRGAGDAGVPASDLQIVYFPFDSSVITPDAVSALKANAGYLRDNPRTTVQIEGHCDERGTVEYNLALGERRASAARDYLRKLGVEGNRMSIISYGKERPQDGGHDESAWSRNRRAAFVVTAQ